MQTESATRSNKEAPTLSDVPSVPNSSMFASQEKASLPDFPARLLPRSEHPFLTKLKNEFQNDIDWVNLRDILLPVHFEGNEDEQYESWVNLFRTTIFYATH